ncbi:hypothetical protein [Fibrobacter sp. UWH4]|uniref:hypothetical protein n=1 Tax=Fibrobacter sp. UWH4 TaxID=1896210 RepID=UPI00091E6FC5|nr:hypothetical protein [Fibrobacter sp. UWH4]SHL05378.1 hypothetical protein SAMN05720762_10469 [Fibrobacter sp. UWH4]
MKKVWWAKVFFDDFCAHYFAKTDDEIVKDVKQSIKSLLEKDGSGNSFGAKMVNEATKRVNALSETRRDAINKRWHPEEGRKMFGQAAGFPTARDIYDFASVNGLSEGDARDFYEMTFVERGGKDRFGNNIDNWQGACKRFCESRAGKRNGNDG